MQAINRPFVALINGTKQFIIPAFQRDYSWTTQQCKQMWDDIVRASSSHGGHFIGSFVCVEGNTTPVFGSWLVIDGQQRLTTLSLLLMALRDHILETGWTRQEPTAAQIDAYFLTNEHESGDRRYKVALRRHDDATLRALVDSKDPFEMESRSELVVEAYRYFREQLKRPEVNPELVYQGVGRLNIVEVTLHRPMDDPQRVFESLNSTGVDLTQSDLIRNYLLMGLPEPDQTRMYDDYWSKIETLFRLVGSPPDTFLRDYIALRQGTTTQARADRIYAEFRDFWQPSDTDALEDLLEDIVRFARYFIFFLKPDRIRSKPLTTAMRQVRSLGSAHAMLIMRLYNLYDEKALTHDDFIQALDLISSYLVRRSVLGMQTRGYWAVFARIAHSVTNEDPLGSFQVALARQNYRFPTDDDFVSALQESDLYRLRICWHILSQLENAGQNEPSPVSEYSIEHIMPQSIDNIQEWKDMLGREDWEEVHRTWLHRLGNLTLTAYNSTYSNRPFEEKKALTGGFEQSAVRLNKYVRQQAQWTAAEMEKRSRTLARRALDIWPHHNADERLVIAEEIRELRTRSASRKPDSMNMSTSVAELLYAIRDSIRELGESIGIVERNSLCFYNAQSAGFFAETLPMSSYVRILLPLDFEEIDDPEGVASDVTAWKFLVNVTHRDCGVFIDIWNKESIPKAVAMVRQAFNVVEE